MLHSHRCSRTTQQYPDIVLKVRARDEFRSSQRESFTCNPGKSLNNLDYIEVSIRTSADP